MKKTDILIRQIILDVIDLIELEPQIQYFFNDFKEDLEPDLHLSNDLAITGLDKLMFLGLIEEKIRKDIPSFAMPEEAEDIESLTELIAFVTELVNA